MRALAKNPEHAADFSDSITSIKAEIADVQREAQKAENIDEDFEEFMRFSLDYVEHLKDNWWAAEDPEERIQLKQLLYLDGLQVFRDGKVRTPTLSPIYRYKTSKKTPEGTLMIEISSSGGSGGT